MVLLSSLIYMCTYIKYILLKTKCTYLNTNNTANINIQINFCNFIKYKEIHKANKVSLFYIASFINVMTSLFLQDVVRLFVLHLIMIIPFVLKSILVIFHQPDTVKAVLFDPYAVKNTHLRVDIEILWFECVSQLIHKILTLIIFRFSSKQKHKIKKRNNVKTHELIESIQRPSYENQRQGKPVAWEMEGRTRGIHDQRVPEPPAICFNLYLLRAHLVSDLLGKLRQLSYPLGF